MRFYVKLVVLIDNRLPISYFCCCLQWRVALILQSSPQNWCPIVKQELSH